MVNNKSLFGTDGVRGCANVYPMTADIVLRLGKAAGQYFKSHASDTCRVVLGKDTRLSGYMIENAITAGLSAAGMNVLLLGPIPTPAVGFLTKAMRADLGIMISASHNPYQDNGIKFFDANGFKLSDQTQTDIEALLEQNAVLSHPTDIGRAKRIDDGRGRYIEYAKSTFPTGLRLDGLKIVVDCANGAGYKLIPEVFWELGADVIEVGVNPNGLNINQGCGSTAPALTQTKVLDNQADIGICLDGDADRVVFIDEKGQVAHGDQIMAFFATRWIAQNKLKSNELVSTIMSTLALEHYLKQNALSLYRTAVGDRYVVEAMRARGANLGGETSGHIVMTDYATTGDGLLTALQFLAEMIQSNTLASALMQQFHLYPTLNKNITISNPYTNTVDSVLQHKHVLHAQQTLEQSGLGRLIVRQSGTEPVVRVLAECNDEALLAQVFHDVVGTLETHLS